MRMPLTAAESPGTCSAPVGQKPPKAVWPYVNGMMAGVCAVPGDRDVGVIDAALADGIHTGQEQLQGA